MPIIMTKEAKNILSKFMEIFRAKKAPKNERIVAGMAVKINARKFMRLLFK